MKTKTSYFLSIFYNVVYQLNINFNQMKKILLSVLLIGISCIGNAQTYFSDNFSNGLGNFTTYDVDGHVPASGVSSLFGTSAPYKAWTISSSVALSTSWYTPVGTSNDWLVTTLPINIQSSSTYLTWKGKAYDPNYRDGYKVYISTKGNKVSDFTNAAVLTVANENYSWTTRSVNLAAYVGQNIYIAFVNNSTDQYTLGIDDIFVGGTNFSITDATSQYLYTESTSIKGTLVNIGTPITEFTAKYTANNKTYTKTFSGLNILPGDSYFFELPDLLRVTSVGNSVSYSIEVISNSISKTSTGSVTWASFKPTKKVIAEEATGTWCGWCPRGAVYLKSVSEKYPDSFIGIGVHNGDPMTYSVYDTGINSFISGYPSGVVDRKYTVDPSAFESYYLTALNDFCPASFSLSGVFIDATKKSVKLTTNTTFNANYNATANFRIAFVVTENNVKGTASGYNQSNYYSGGSKGTMGGFESLSNPVPAAQMTYQDVARQIYNSFIGIAGSVPATINLNQELKYEYTITLPTTINNLSEVDIIAMLIDINTGQIKNADRIKASSLSVTAVESPKSSNSSVLVLKSASEISVEVETNSVGAITASLYGIDGKQIYMATVSNECKYNFKIPYTGLKGVFIIRVKTSDGAVDKKIIL